MRGAALTPGRSGPFRPKTKRMHDPPAQIAVVRAGSGSVDAGDRHPKWQGKEKDDQHQHQKEADINGEIELPGQRGQKENRFP